MENINASKTRPNFFLHSKKTESQKTKNAVQNDLISSDEKKIPFKRDLQAKTAMAIPKATRDFARIKKAVDNAPALDKSEKIAHLKKQIQNGDYKIDYEALAEKILQSEF